MGRREYRLLNEIGKIIPEEIIKLKFKSFFRYKNDAKNLQNIAPVKVNFNNLQMTIDVIKDNITLVNLVPINSYDLKMYK